jgi:tetratricopeptide (TPR) repeat protein
MQGNCPSCNRVYDISEEFLAMGGKVKCPHCMEELEFIDAPDQAAKPDPRLDQTRIDPNRKNAQTRVEPEEVDARCGSCERRFKIDTQYLRMGGQAKCPHCSLDLIFDVPQQAPPPKEPEEDLWAETEQTVELGADAAGGAAEGDEGYDEGEGGEYDDPYASTGEVRLSELAGLDDLSDQDPDQDPDPFERRGLQVYTTDDPDPSDEVVVGQLEPAFGDQTAQLGGLDDDSASAVPAGDEPVLGTLIEEDEEDEAMPEIGADSDEATQQVSAEFSLTLDADAQMENQLRDELEHELEEGLADDLGDEEEESEQESEQEEASVVVDGALVEAADSGLAADGDWASAAAAWADSGFLSESMPSFVKSEPPPGEESVETGSEQDQPAPVERTAPSGETLDSLRAKGMPAGASADSVEVSDSDILMLDDDEIEQLEDEPVSAQNPTDQESWAQRATRDVDHGEAKQKPVQTGSVPRRSALYSKLTSPPMLAAALGLTVLVIVSILWVLLGSAEEVEGIAFPTEGLKVKQVEAPQPKAYKAKESAAKLYGLGNRAAYMGQFEEAIRQFQSASRADPGFPHPHRAMGAIYAVLGRGDLSIVSYETYLQLAPKGSDAAYVTKILREVGTK